MAGQGNRNSIGRAGISVRVPAQRSGCTRSVAMRASFAGTAPPIEDPMDALGPVEPRPKAYSYVRFSTPEQAKGDSLRRQTDRARAWAVANDLERTRR
jgi:hypothetical protein